MREPKKPVCCLTERSDYGLVRMATAHSQANVGRHMRHMHDASPRDRLHECLRGRWRGAQSNATFQRHGHPRQHQRPGGRQASPCSQTCYEKGDVRPCNEADDRTYPKTPAVFQNLFGCPITQPATTNPSHWRADTATRAAEEHLPGLEAGMPQNCPAMSEPIVEP